jgi:hypothetical protein
MRSGFDDCCQHFRVERATRIELAFSAWEVISCVLLRTALDKKRW